MASRIIVKPRAVSARELEELITGTTLDPESLSFVDLDVLPGADMVPHQLFHEMDWHIREVEHLNSGKSRMLSFPVIGKLIRDQHEINRLLLIGAEMAIGLLEEIERGTGRHYSRLRTDQRANWVKRFRYLGLRWKTARQAVRALREHWELGRCPRWRLRSRADQARMNLLAEECLCSMTDIVAALLDSLGDGNGEAPEMETRLASCLWHAREGRAVRGSKSSASLKDRQSELNRLYRITLEQMSWILKNLMARLHKRETNPQLPA